MVCRGSDPHVVDLREGDFCLHVSHERGHGGSGRRGSSAGRARGATCLKIVVAPQIMGRGIRIGILTILVSDSPPYHVMRWPEGT